MFDTGIYTNSSNLQSTLHSLNHSGNSDSSVTLSTPVSPILMISNAGVSKSPSDLDLLGAYSMNHSEHCTIVSDSLALDLD